MKEKILHMKIIAAVTSWPIAKALSENRVLGKLFNYEMISYIICGAVTTAVNYGVYFIVPKALRATSFGIILANFIAWVAAVLFAFTVNKIFVFDSPSWEKKVFFREFISFVVCRILSFFLDTAFVYVTVHMLGLNEPLFKLLSNVFVLIANYIASKLFIFKKEK